MDYRRYGGLPNQPEAALCQILQEAQHRWLRPTEICEILRNYRKFKLTPDPPHKPQSGSLFLFDRKALRYFRKDGHNWRKKKDGKTVREAHERLKAGSVEVLHCYYAHGEDNENFQRRSYWMLDTNEHIVLVHYREVKEGSRSGLRSPNSYSIDGSSSFGNPRGVAGTSPQTSPLVSPRSSSPSTADWNGGVTNSPELDDHESSDDTDQYRLREIETLNNGTNKGGTVIGNTTFTGNAGHLSSSYFPVASNSGAGHGDKVLLGSYEAMNGTATSINPSLPLAGGAQIKQEINSVAPPGGFDLYEYGEVLKKAKGWGTNGTSEISNSRFQNNLSQHRDMPMASDNPYTWFKSNAEMTMNNVMGASQSSGNTRMAWQSGSQGFLDTIPTPATKYQCFPGDGVPSAQVPSTANTNAIPWNAVVTQLDGADNGLLNDSQRTNHAFAQDFSGNRDTLSTKDSLNRFNPLVTSIDTKDSSPLHSYSSVFRDFQADTPTQHEDMQILKFETFERWMGQEMGADGMLSSDSTWANVLAEDVPGLAQQMPVGMQTTASLLQEICFSITEFSPSCATLGFDTKVLVCGEFGVEVRDPSQVKWSCMFADIEVPAEVLQNGVLRCNVPSHPPGKVPFFVTRSDKIPCSEIKEFEFRAESKSSAETLEVDRFSKRHMLFQIRLARMLSNVSVPLRSLLSDQLDKDMISELTSLGLFGEWEDMEEQLTESGLGTNLREQYIQKLLKEKLQIWLLQKVLEGGKGAAVWDDNGLGVLHMGAALGYTWIIGPLLASGVNINFRDSRGWTALHWAAHCGREAMVIALLARGAAPGARTDPTNAFPGGQAPADLASAERHKGIAGYLAESSLTSHLSSLNLKSKSAQGLPIATDAVESASKMSIVQSSEGGPEVQLPLTLAAVRNATQAVARIQTEFRLESFRKKQESYQLEEDEYGISNEEAQYIVAAQKSGRGPSLYEDELSQVNAAIRIQQNYRGWKGRRNFLLFRQHVVKIQAHFRGHQVRKHYKKILWSVSIVEKAILRWRRKGRGLRGFGSIPLPENELGRNEEDDDFLKAGRKQIEASLEKALARVQSMVRSPEAQEQYRRLLEGYQKTKVHFEGNYDMLLTPGDKGHIFSEDYTMSTLR